MKTKKDGELAENSVLKTGGSVRKACRREFDYTGHLQGVKTGLVDLEIDVKAQVDFRCRHAASYSLVFAGRLAESDLDVIAGNV